MLPVKMLRGDTTWLINNVCMQKATSSQVRGQDVIRLLHLHRLTMFPDRDIHILRDIDNRLPDSMDLQRSFDCGSIEA
jgi:hypothetical protein